MQSNFIKQTIQNVGWLFQSKVQHKIMHLTEKDLDTTSLKRIEDQLQEQVDVDEQQGALLSQEEQDAILSNLTNVGKTKLLGDIKFGVCIEKLNKNPFDLKREAEARELSTLLVILPDVSYECWSLAVYDKEALQSFLDIPENKDILNKNNAPLTADEYVFEVKTNAVSSTGNRDYYDLIALSFNDQRPEYQNYEKRSDGPVAFSAPVCTL